MSLQVSWFSGLGYHLTQYENGKQKYPLFVPYKRSGSAVFRIYGAILSSTLNRIADTALRKIQSSSLGPKGDLFKIGTKLIHPVIDDWKEFKEEEKETGLATQAMGLTGLLPKDLNACMAIAKNFAKAFFKDDLLFTYSNSYKTMQTWKKDQMVAAQNFLYTKIGMKQSDEPVAFTEHDFQFFGIEKSDSIADPKTINCCSFALLKAKVIQAAKLIFEGAEVNRHMHELFQKLSKWDYEATIEPKPNDLVVYLDDKNKPTHVGVYLGENRVQSKIGIANPYSHEHTLFAIEDQAIFFTKKNSS